MLGIRLALVVPALAYATAAPVVVSNAGVQLLLK